LVTIQIFLCPKEFRYFSAANFIFVPTASTLLASVVPVITLFSFRNVPYSAKAEGKVRYLKQNLMFSFQSTD
jgi:hypothetical protein